MIIYIGVTLILVLLLAILEEWVEKKRDEEDYRE